MQSVVSDQPFLLSTATPSKIHLKIAFWLIAILFFGLLATLPFAQTSLTELADLLPAYAAAALLCEGLTAALLFALFSAHLSPAILVLASGYLFSALSIVPWSLTFPEIGPALGVNVELQSAAFVAAFRRIGFPAFVLAYLALRNRPAIRGQSTMAGNRMIVAAILTIIAAVFAIGWVAIDLPGHLPTFMSSPLEATPLWRYVPAAAIALYGAALVWLLLSLRTVIDLWLIVILFAMTIETILLGYVSAGVRMNLGWWAGRLYGLTSSGIVLTVLFIEQVSLHGRLARSMIAERRSRANRLTAMEALSASIAHEINQPLASIVTNADAGLRWLGRGPDHADEVVSTLRRIVDDGHRAGKVVETIRSMFKSGTRHPLPIDLNRLVIEAMERAADELRLSRITTSLDLQRPLPQAQAEPIQIQQVLANLISNAVDAMEVQSAGERSLCISTRRTGGGFVAIAICDTGVGIPADQKASVFEPFYTTKSDGMGMGLMFCRLAVEAHGGSITVMDNEPRGTVFEISLPIVPEAGGPGETIRDEA